MREQFTVDRIEVNVVGDFDEHNLLHQLNAMLGTMPLRRDRNPNSATITGSVASPRAPFRVGYDIYEPSHQRFFQTRAGMWQSGAVTPPAAPQAASTDGWLNCSLPSTHPGRAYVALALLTNADFSSARGHQKALLSHALFQQTLLNVLRRDAGAVFSVESQPFMSQLYQRFG